MSNLSSNNENSQKKTKQFDEELIVNFERVSLLFPRLSIGFAGMGIAVSLFGYYIYRFSSLTLSIIWVSAMFTAYIPRVVLSSQYRKADSAGQITPENIQSWEDKLFWRSILPFLVFASMALLPYPEKTFQGVMASAFSITSLVAGGVLLYSPSRKVIQLFLDITQSALIIRCFYEGGADFYILATYVACLYILMTKLIRMQNSLIVQNIRAKVHNKQESLEDPLTGLGNRRRLEFAEKLFNMSKRSDLAFQVVIFDIDHFKKFNDNHGHIAGDKLLIDISRIINENVRHEDILIRYGGEEFLAVLPATSLEQSLTFVSRILERVKAQTAVTISAGISSLSNQQDLSELISEADKALYQAKNQGRDQYVISASSGA